MNHQNTLLGIDLGGTKIEIIALDIQGTSLYRTRTPTPKHSNPSTQYQQILKTITSLVTNCENHLQLFGLPLGVGIPGAVSLDTGRIKNANTTCLIGQDLIGDLSAILERPIKIENDANCFALSEATDGAGKDAQCVFAVILGTGVGGGWVINNTLITGANAIAGEWGHNPLPSSCDKDEPKQPCYCGKNGCIETYLSGPGFSRQTQLQFGFKGSCPEIMLARKHTQSAKRSYERYIDRLARSLASVINILDPDVIVLGGGVSNTQGLCEDVMAIWKAYIFSDTVKTKLLINTYGDSSGVRGAAWLNKTTA